MTAAKVTGLDKIGKSGGLDRDRRTGGRVGNGGDGKDGDGGLDDGAQA